MPLKCLQHVGSSLFLPLEESSRVQGVGHLSSAKQGCEEKSINREGWALFKSLTMLGEVLEIQAKGYVGSKLQGRGSRACVKIGLHN